MINVDRAFIIESLSCLLLITLGKDVVQEIVEKLMDLVDLVKTHRIKFTPKFTFLPRPPIFSFFVAFFFLSAQTLFILLM